MRGLFLVALACVAGCCDPNAIGAPCVIPASASTSDGVALVSPALECSSKLCLITRHASDELSATCTNECEKDGDCAMAATVACRAGYVCGHVGDFTSGVCLCRD